MREREGRERRRAPLLDGLDEVAVDFPELTIIACPPGWPWVHELIAVAWRHPNVYLDISGIPPKTLLKYFPRLEEIAAKTLFGAEVGNDARSIAHAMEVMQANFIERFNSLVPLPLWIPTPANLRARKAARQLKISPSTLYARLKGKEGQA